MTARLITKPVRLAVSLAAAKLALRIEPDMTELDPDIDDWIRSIAEEAEHSTGRAFISQKWRVTLGTVSGRVALPNPPLISVDSVKYYDAENVEQTLDPAQYLVNESAEPAYIEPVAGGAWPTLHSRPDAFMVDYTCGYGLDESSVPNCVKAYIKAKLCVQFNPSTGGPKPFNVEYLDSLLDGVKVYS